MPKFQVRNRRTKVILGEVVAADPAFVIDEMKDATGASIEEIAASLGSTLEEAIAALDIVEIPQAKVRHAAKKMEFAPLPRRRLFA